MGHAWNQLFPIRIKAANEILSNSYGFLVQAAVASVAHLGSGYGDRPISLHGFVPR